MLDFSNGDFDVNILEKSLSEPTIEFSFPLPTDAKKYIKLDQNANEISQSWSLLQNFFNYVTGVKWNEIYGKECIYESVDKHSAEFNEQAIKYMNEKLTHGDKYLDSIVDDLINQEIRLKLTDGKNYQKRFQEVKEFMIHYYTKENKKNLPGFSSQNMLRVCYFTVLSIFKKMFPHGVWCNREEVLKLYKCYLEDPMSILYFPNHQSHIDYIMLHILSVRFQISTPAVIAGDNLNVTGFGAILKSLGGIFIKRSFNNELYTERNLSNFIEFILLNKIHFEVFIEGTRSRDGKLLLPKFGIIKTLANIYLKQREEENNMNFDMLVQPVSITYERIYEADGYLKELLGKDKKKESGTAILKNGMKNYFNPATKDEINGDYDNSTKQLHGKVFIKLGNHFKFSEFVNDDLKTKHLDTTQIELIPGSKINLKKFGFKVLHEINRCSYLPEISLIGSAIQTHYNLYKRSEFEIFQLVPILRLLIEVFSEEEYDNETNVKLLKNVNSYTDKELVQLVKEQVPQFFREIKINFKENKIEITDNMELLYYKNLTIHILIHRSLASFILLSLPDHMRTSNFLRKMFYIFTGFLKNEFLFDYDFNERHNLSFILNDLERSGKIEKTEFTQESISKILQGASKSTSFSQSYKVLDHYYLNCFSEIVKPFIESYLLCIFRANEIITRFNEKNGVIDVRRLFIDDTEMEYLDTKLLLKTIQDKQQSGDDSEKTIHVESTNKQYLLSCLYYLNHLKLIDIVKNKARTKAFVFVTNGKDCLFVYRFLTSLVCSSNLEGSASFITDISVNYMIDIIDKNFERNEVEVSTTTESNLHNIKLKSRI